MTEREVEGEGRQRFQTQRRGCWQRMWAGQAVCGLLVRNVGPFAANAGPKRDLLAPNVSRKASLFAGPGAAVCGPLQLPHALQNAMHS
jgi:hypothetical protein